MGSRAQVRPLLPLLGAVVCAAAAPASAATVHRVVLDAPITPIQAEFVTRAIGEAERAGSELVLLEIDTPGGLVSAMEEIIQRMLASKVPVCAYVHPPGGRAASAGFFLLVSADVAAMAPGTRAGAAHPVLAIGGIVPVGDEPPQGGEGDGGEDDEPSGGGERSGGAGGGTSTLLEKVKQDAQAYLRAITVRRGRNAEAAELAVTESRSYTDTEALEEGLIDLVAGSERELLERLDGREVRLIDGTVRRLATRGAAVVEIEKTFRERALELLTDANVAFLMLLIGALLIYVEVTHAGMVVPGVVGGILLLLAVTGFSFLPISVAGVLLLLAGVGLLIAEVFVQGFGIFGIGGAACLALGAIFLVDVPDASLGVDAVVAVPAAVTVGGIMVFLGYLAVRASKRPRATGSEALVGEEGEVVAEVSAGEGGKVLLHGEYWNATARETLARGTRVRCVKVEGLQIEVEPAAGGAPVSGKEGSDAR